MSCVPCQAVFSHGPRGRVTVRLTCVPESPLPASSLNPKQLQARGSGLEKATPPHDPPQVIFGEMSFERNSSKKDPVVSGARLWRRPWALSGGGDAASCVWPGESGPEGAGTAAHTGRRGVAVAERLGGTGPGATVQEESRPSQEHSAAAARAPGLRGREGWVPGCQGGSVLLALVVGASAGRIARLQGSTRCHPFKGSAGLRRGPCALFWAPFLDAWKGLRGRRGAAPPAIDLCDKDP